ncbi:MAG TPA: serine hydrolase domain-containing protein [Caulobacteraceae bacterium]|nr:serine hydrolase domain-containing protein [Caulobacteraceae bacterium]
MRRRTFTLTAPLAGFGLTLVGPARAQPAASPAPAAADLIGPILAETKTPSLAGAVVARDGLPWLEVGGVRQGPGSAAVTKDDLWHLGSNTKAMTAALYAKLVEQGKAHWGATVPELFPKLKVDAVWKATTVEALMSHTAGLSDKPLVDPAWLVSARSDPRPLAEQRRAFAARAFHAPPAGKPGSFEYANANFIIAGAAIEAIAGAPWEDVIRAELFAPLHMDSAGFGAPTGDEPWGHTADGTPVDPAGIADNPAALGPAGTVHVSLEDYAKFLRLFITGGGDFLSPDSIRRLTTPYSDADQSYALGWGVYKSRPWANGPVLFHEGSNTLWDAVALVAPARGLAFIGVSNDFALGHKATTALMLKLIGLFAPTTPSSGPAPGPPQASPQPPPH